MGHTLHIHSQTSVTADTTTLARVFRMENDHLILILSAEALIVCLFITGLLLLKNRRLRKLVAQLQARLIKLSERCKNLVTPTAPPPAPAPEVPYQERLDQQLEATKEYHFSLGSRQDIALDLDPDAPLARRTAAIRHAFLIAEKEATATDELNWNLLGSRYQQLLSFHEDYSAEPSAVLEQRVEQALDDLQLAKKRVANLERFKAMYFELEERWEKCRGKADERYTELQAMAAETAQPKDFHDLLEAYHSSYSDIDAIIEAGKNEPQEVSLGIPADSQLHELRRLRSVTAEQHRIISELQNRLSSGSSLEEQTTVMESLQGELSKQARFLQESETCIRLMEDELANANRELEQIRNRASQAANLRVQVQELEETVATNDQIIGSLQQENRRLTKKLKVAQEAPPADSAETRALRKEVSSLQSRYNDLEEKFLNLKLKG